MPAVSQPGSRAGLITALVIFVLATFVAGGLYVSAYVKIEDAEREKAAAAKKLNEFVNQSTEAATDEYTKLVQTAQSPQAKRSVFAVLKEQRDEAIKLVTGESATLDTARKAKKDALDLARARLDAVGKPFDSDALAPGLSMAVNFIPSLTDDVKKSSDEKVAASKRDADAQIAALNEKITAAEAAAAKLVTERDGLLKKVEVAEQSRTTDVEKQSADQKQKVQEMQDQINKINVDLSAKIQEVENSKKQVEALKNVTRSRRINVTTSLVRNVDGYITNVGRGAKTVFINLGLGDGVPAGITFEVYDKDQGIPKAIPGSLDEDQLPSGKASIELVTLGQNSSECRVIRVTPGMTIVEGDLIGNLVYDKNVRFNFAVYAGDGFDLANTGRPTASGGEIIKTLIKKWGGTVLDGTKDALGNPKLSVETDFLVMGKEPVVPRDDPNDPIIHNQFEEARKRLKAFDDMRAAAIDLHIPVMNQNRFLYFIGYFDQAKRIVP